MGLCFQQITGNGPVMEQTELNLSNGWVWVVLRRDPTKQPADWHLQGVAADEGLALKMCKDETYIIGPLPINTALPEQGIEWVGSYFPLKK